MQHPLNYGKDSPDFHYYPPKSPRFVNKLRSDKPIINIILFLLTIASTWLVKGVWYSISIIIILLAHEMGHYFMCRKYNIRATLPFFLPFPLPQLNPFGTLGAVIKIEDRIPNRKALFDVGVAGPLAGLFFTIPEIIIGLKLSPVIKVSDLPTNVIYYNLGESVLFSQLAKFVIGDLPAGYDIVLHPMAFAGWAGLFVTALNLLPIGQLDGGHVLYAIFGQNSKNIYKIVLGVFVIICAVWYPGWLLLIILLIWFGYRHPPPIDDYTPLDKKRRILGYIVFVIFIISFTPIPFYLSS